MKTLTKIILSIAVFTANHFAVAQIPPTLHSNEISYISGGVGEEETIAILAEAKQWPVLVELSQIENGRGVWIFGAKIKIINAKKQAIFDAQADGPYMLINLSPGDYLLQASYEGVEQNRVLSVKAGSPQKIPLFWK